MGMFPVRTPSSVSAALPGRSRFMVPAAVLIILQIGRPSLFKKESFDEPIEGEVCIHVLLDAIQELSIRISGIGTQVE
jgi:hypothetical protein